MAAAYAVFALTSCQEKETPATEDVAGPEILWASNPDFETQVITESMDVKISITAPAGISSFVVTVTSDALTPIIGGSTLDFVNPSNDLIGGIVSSIIGEGVSVAGATDLDLDLSNLVPLILTVTQEEDDHVFKLDITDANGKTATATCTFHRAAVTVSVSEVDLWANTAVVTVGGGSELAYRVKGTENWNVLTATDGKYTIGPEWTEGTNENGLSVYTLTEGTGIFAGNTYEFQVDGTLVESADFTAEDGDVIPNGDMSGWSWKDEEKTIQYPNASGESFWDSGNNSMAAAFGVVLCMEDQENPGVSYMKAGLVLGAVFTPGNMYVGDFSMGSFGNGTANFGKVYDWTARPSALKVRYKSTVGTIDKFGTYDPIGAEMLEKQDTTRIYAVVVDWTKQHGVTSGLGEPTGMWDPTDPSTVSEEGSILGYAILDIVASQAEFTDVEIPFVWYDKAAKPTEGNYSLVISCATSKRGDYLTGCSSNELWVDNFEWVY